MEPTWVAARWGVAVGMMAGAAWMDVRIRRVPNRYWYPFLATAAVLWVVDAFSTPWRDLGIALGIAAAACILFYGLWYVRLLFGGADAKALMVLAVLVPWNLPDGALRILPAIDVLANGLLLTLLVPVGLLGWNLGHGRWAGPATFLAVPLPRSVAHQRFVWPMEHVEEDRVRRRLMPPRGEDLDERYEALAVHGVETVWATPKVPFVVPLFGGLLLAAWQGDLILWGLQQILG